MGKLLALALTLGTLAAGCLPSVDVKYVHNQRYSPIPSDQVKVIYGAHDEVKHFLRTRLGAPKKLIMRHVQNYFANIGLSAGDYMQLAEFRIFDRTAKYSCQEADRAVKKAAAKIGAQYVYVIEVKLKGRYGYVSAADKRMSHYYSQEWKFVAIRVLKK